MIHVLVPTNIIIGDFLVDDMEFDRQEDPLESPSGSEFEFNGSDPPPIVNFNDMDSSWELEQGMRPRKAKKYDVLH